jgi:tetratricopeptide (TPR) repeat protein
MLALCAISSFGWAGAKPSSDANSPEGRLLDKAQKEGDLSRKLVLLELFPDLFPSSPSMEYVWTELQIRYFQAGKLPKALAAGSNALNSNPNSLEVACLNWRIAADMKDAALTTVWMKQAGYVAERVQKNPDPEMSKATLECGASARQANEGDAYQAAVNTKNPAERVKLLEQFLADHPQTTHAGEIENSVFQAYREQGDAAKTLAAAEKLVAKDDTREDAMLLVAESYFKSGRDPERVLSLSKKAIDRLNSMEKPEGMSAADWARNKSTELTQAQYMVGSITFQAGRWEAADQAFRAALPNLTDPRFRAEALNSLGWANYKLKNVSDSIKFYIECTNIPGPWQQAAAKTLNTITAEYRIK